MIIDLRLAIKEFNRKRRERVKEISSEVYGDEGMGHELPDGCWSEDQVKDMQEAIKRLTAEPVYEGGKKNNGISQRFLCRIQALAFYAELKTIDDPFVVDARKILGKDF